MTRWAQRASAAVVGLVAAVAWAGIAGAHVEVEADPDVAGSTNAMVTFSAEAENPSSGIVSVQIVLPADLSTADITFNKGPKGWTSKPSTGGYTVSGPALPKGTDAVHSVIVKRLPDTNELIFKAIVTYADKSVDRWIEEKSASNPNPENPAPVLALKPGARPPATTTTAATASPTVALAPAPSSSPSASTSTDDGGSGWIWWVLAAVIVAGGLVAFAVTRRRRDAAGR